MRLDMIRGQVAQPHCSEAAPRDMLEVSAIGGDRVGPQAGGDAAGQPSIEPLLKSQLRAHRQYSTFAPAFENVDLGRHLGLSLATDMLALAGARLLSERPG